MRSRKLGRHIISWFAAGLTTLMVLSGCEAELNLGKVQAAEADPIKRFHFYQAVAGNEHTVVLVGNDGVVLRSEPGAGTWESIDSGTRASIIDVAVCPDERFIALTFDKSILKGSRDGRRWSEIGIPTEEEVQALTCAPDNAWWVVGGFTTILSSHDQGVSWNEDSFMEDALLTNIQFVADDRAVVAGEYGILSTTKDNGESWEMRPPVPDEFYIHAISFESLETGWVGGLKGFIFRTENGGETWIPERSDSEAPIFNFVKNGDQLFAVGDYSTILQRQGNTWNRIPGPEVPLYFRAAYALSPSLLLLAGGAGLLQQITIDVASTQKGISDDV